MRKERPIRMDKNLFEGLNVQQVEAVKSTDGPLVIVAGPGSGKTRVIVHRIAYLIQELGVKPYNIAAVTFTNKASREMKQRLSDLLKSDYRDLTVATFHGLCALILRHNGTNVGITTRFVIYDDADQLSLVKKAMEQADVDDKRISPRSIADSISEAKSKLISFDDYEASASTYFERIVASIYGNYQELLSRNDAVDFDDLLFKTYVLLRDNDDIAAYYRERYVHLMIDEFQDTNTAQYAIARQLSSKHQNICVVGDPDQSIYSWRHADIRNILSFQRDFPKSKMLALEQNYRSSQNILHAAEAVISENSQRIERKLFTSRPTGSPIVVNCSEDQNDEADWVFWQITNLLESESEDFSLSDVAIMYRVNAQSRSLEEVCVRRGVPYKLIGGLRFYQRKEIKDVIAYLRVIINPKDDVSFERIINIPNRGIGRKTQDLIWQSANRKGVSMSEYLTMIDEGSDYGDFVRKGSLIKFANLIRDLSKEANDLKVSQLYDRIVEHTGYRSYILDGSEEGQDRWQNILELRGVTKEFDELSSKEGQDAFLEKAALLSDIDQLDDKAEGVTLITLHQAKGLEYSVVFIVGMEEGVLPHARSLDDHSEMEEERRLFYVGMTRAKDKLFLTRANVRRMSGNVVANPGSRFLLNIPSSNFTYYSDSDNGDESHSESRVSSTESSNLGEMEFGTHVEAETKGSQSVSSPTSGSDLSPGEKVAHGKFGEGMIVSLKPLRDGDTEVAVAFLDGSVRKFLGSFDSLKKTK